MLEWNIVIGAACAVGGLLISYAVFARGKTKDDRSDGQQTGVMLTELGYIKGSLDGVNAKLDRQEERNLELVQRLSSVEASAKQAHKRIDRLEAVGKED